MTKLLSTTFRSLKPHSQNPKSAATNLPISSPSPSKSNPNWSVYLILSTNPPIKTYVGVTNNFSRRLKQHNGELNGGAKATQAGRPWICACIVRGFESKSEACKFEFKWKSMSSKMTRKKNLKEDGGLHLLQHRNAALQKVKGSFDCIHLEFDWKLQLL
ncbi:putative GIY-YIG endonuclease [Helianthus debilis subsp. tardiflorus]